MICRSESRALDKLQVLGELNQYIPSALRGQWNSDIESCIHTNIQHRTGLLKLLTGKGTRRTDDQAIAELISFYRDIWSKFEVWERTQLITSKEILPTELRQRATAIYAGLQMRDPDGSPYRPSNGTEGEIFIDRWCRQCQKDVQQNCSILAVSLVGQAPEWQYWNSKPLCTAWEALVPPEKQPQARPSSSPSKVSVEVESPSSTHLPDPAPLTEALPLPNPYPFSTGLHQYRGLTYWIQGDPKTGYDDGQFWFFIRRDQDEIQSNQVFDSIITANFAARAAIDTLMGNSAPEPAPTNALKRGSKRGQNA